MIDPSWSKVSVTDFLGSQSALDDGDIPPGRAKLAQNVEFFKGRVSTRRGFKDIPSAFGAEYPVAGMYYHPHPVYSGGVPSTNLFWYVPGTGVNQMILKTGPPSILTVASIATAGVVNASFASSGPRIYVAPFNVYGDAVGAGYVLVGWLSSGTSYDAMFSPPITYVPSAPSEPSAGLITAGSHRLGYIIEFRHGFIGRPSPDSGTGTPAVQTFTPVTFTAAGSKNLSWVLNPTTWPTAAKKVHVIMTPVNNPNTYYFVPGASATVTGGSSDSKTITFSISDEDLIATGAEATNHLFFMTQTTGGTAPFNPKRLLQYGDRMGYITTVNDVNGNPTSCVYFSNRNNYEQITPDQHIVQLPGLLPITTGFALGGTMYLLGTNYTFATTDTGGDPVEWPTPYSVDGSRGTNVPKGATVSSTGQYAWVANQEGLWLFNGSYGDLPISYYQSDVWKTINWAYAATIEVVDDPNSQMVYVLVPLGAATTPSHILSWNYTRGKTADKVSYSTILVGGSYALGSMCLVKNDLLPAYATNQEHMELWVGSSGTGGLMRQASTSDTTPYRDGSAAIQSIYQTGLFPGDSPMQVTRHHGGWLDVYGSGTLSVSLKNTDDTWTQALSDITLAASPGKATFRQHHRIGDGVSYYLTTNAVDAYFTLSELAHYWSPYALQR